MPSASRSIVVNVPPEHMFETITDYESYPDFIPETLGVEIMKKGKAGKDGSRTVDVKFDIKVIKQIDYTLRLTEEPHERVTWELVEGKIFKSNNGSWELKAAGKGKTEATYTVDITIGLLVPQTITNMLVGSSLPKMLEQMKERAEATYKAGGAKKKKS